MSITIVRIAQFDGPNRFDPRPGVLAHLRAGRDAGDVLRAALKDAAQRIGLVIGNLQIERRDAGDGVRHEVFFVTPNPDIGVEALQYVVTLLNTQHAGDDTWDADGLLWDLQKKRRATALPLPALQLIAEASARGIPAFVRRDGLIQAGYGTRSATVDPAILREHASAARAAGPGGATPPFAQSAASSLLAWDRLGAIPVIVISGAGRSAPAKAFIARLRQQRNGVTAALAASFDAARDCLAEPDAEVAVLDLEPSDLLWRGLPVEQCTVSALLGLPEQLTGEAGSRDDLARAMGVALLVTLPGGRAVLNADDPAILALAEYAPCPLVLIARSGDHPALRAHRAANGCTLFLRHTTVAVACGTNETTVLPAPGDDPWETLLAVALHVAFVEADTA